MQLGKKLKKNNVALDIISFGSTNNEIDLSIPSLASSSTAPPPPVETETNDSKLSSLIDSTNSSENSHFLSVEPGPHLLSERIMQSPIARGEASGDDESGSGGGGGGGQADEFGVDPNLDPELAMVSSLSLMTSLTEFRTPAYHWTLSIGPSYVITRRTSTTSRFLLLRSCDRVDFTSSSIGTRSRRGQYSDHGSNGRCFDPYESISTE